MWNWYQQTTPESPTLEQSLPKETPALSTPHPPRARPNKTVNSSTPEHVKMTREDFLQLIGYIKLDKLLRNLDKLGRKNYSVSGLHRSPSINPGEIASIRSNNCNTLPSKVPKKFADVIHIGIAYGLCTAIGGVKYTLLIVDKATRYKFVYRQKSSTRTLMQNFIKATLPTSSKVKAPTSKMFLPIANIKTT